MQEEIKLIEEHHVHAKEMVFQIAEIETDNGRVYVLLINGRENLVSKDFLYVQRRMNQIIRILN